MVFPALYVRETYAKLTLVNVSGSTGNTVTRVGATSDYSQLIIKVGSTLTGRGEPANG
jgi:hypothetical protein